MERNSSFQENPKTLPKNQEEVQSPGAYLLIPLHQDFFHQRRSCLCLHSLLFSTLHVILLTAAVILLSFFFLWPSNPDLRLSAMKLRSLGITTKHKGTLVALTVAADLKIKVHNRAFFALDYDNVTVGVEYRGRRLGSVAAAGGSVAARGVSVLAAQLRLDGVRVLEDAIFLVEDLVKGKIPLDTVTMVTGDLRIRSIQVPIQGKISCSVVMDVEKQAIASQNCFPEIINGPVIVEREQQNEVLIELPLSYPIIVRNVAEKLVVVADLVKFNLVDACPTRREKAPARGEKMEERENQRREKDGAQ